VQRQVSGECVVGVFGELVEGAGSCLRSEQAREWDYQSRCGHCLLPLWTVSISGFGSGRGHHMVLLVPVVLRHSPLRLGWLNIHTTTLECILRLIFPNLTFRFLAGAKNGQKYRQRKLDGLCSPTNLTIINPSDG
jgi:hypothetical protein